MGFFAKLFKKKNKEVDEPKIVKSVEKPSAPATVKETEPVKREADVKVEVKPAPAKNVRTVTQTKEEKPQVQKQAPQPHKTKPAVQKQAPQAQNEKPQAKESTVKSKISTGFFEIKKSKDDRYVFNLYASNNVIIATSQVYSSSQSAINGAKSVIENASKAKIEDQTLKNFAPESFPKWEIYKDKAGQFRFRLSASNGSCVCHSQGYTNKANCKNGIESIIRTAANAKIDKAYLIKK